MTLVRKHQIPCWGPCPWSILVALCGPIEPRGLGEAALHEFTQLRMGKSWLRELLGLLGVSKPRTRARVSE